MDSLIAKVVFLLGRVLCGPKYNGHLSVFPSSARCKRSVHDTGLLRMVGSLTIQPNLVPIQERPAEPAGRLISQQTGQQTSQPASQAQMDESQLLAIYIFQSSTVSGQLIWSSQLSLVCKILGSIPTSWFNYRPDHASVIPLSDMWVLASQAIEFVFQLNLHM